MPSSAGPDRGPLLGVGGDQRQPHPLRGAGRASPARALTGIGLVVTESRLVDGRQLGVDLAGAVEVAAWAASHISRIWSPTTCEATVMPPAPPNSSTRRKVLSLPARTVEALDRAQLVVVGLLDGDDVVDRGQLGEQLRAAC